MLVRIFEVQIHYEIIYLISILRLYTFCYNMLSMLYHLLSHIYLPLLLVIIFRTFILFYFISILIPTFSLDFWNSFIFQIHFTKNNPLCTDPQVIWKCKCFFVTVTMVIYSPQPTLYSVIFSYICLSRILDKYFHDIIVC